MEAGLRIHPLGGEAKVNEMDWSVTENVFWRVFACVNHFLAVADKNIVRLQIIVNEAAIVN